MCRTSKTLAPQLWVKESSKMRLLSDSTYQAQRTLSDFYITTTWHSSSLSCLGAFTWRNLRAKRAIKPFNRSPSLTLWAPGIRNSMTGWSSDKGESKRSLTNTMSKGGISRTRSRTWTPPSMTMQVTMPECSTSPKTRWESIRMPSRRTPSRHWTLSFQHSWTSKTSKEANSIGNSS